MDDLAVELNHLFAPFNVYDHRDGAANFFIAMPSKYVTDRRDPKGLQFQIFFMGEVDVNNSDDYAEIVHNGKFWQESDKTYSEDYLAEEMCVETIKEVHEDLAMECLRLVWWGDLDAVSSMLSIEETQQMSREQLGKEA